MKSFGTELPVVTRDGVFVATYTEQGLARLEFPQSKPGTGHAVNEKSVPTQILRWHKQTTKAMQALLAGRDPAALPPLDWRGKTDFQQAVWQAMLRIPAGQTKSYGEIARDIKNPQAVRAVGGACGANPIPVLVPCHRILAARQKIGGYSGAKGWKEKLLTREGAAFKR